MADNRAKYGFRYYGNLSGSGRMPIQEFRIASTYSAQVASGTTDVGLYVGDVVSLLADGTVALFADNAASEDAAPFGVIAGFSNVKFGPENKARPSSYYPVGGVTYGDSNTETRVQVVPFTQDIIWEVDVDDAVTATTKAAYEALIGENTVIAAYVPDTADSNKPKANPKIDISVNTTTVDDFRIWGISKTQDNVDFSGANVKILVIASDVRMPFNTQTGF